MQQTSSKNPSILCLLDHALGNMIIHYSKTRVLHPGQGFDDILEVIRVDNLLLEGTKLVYLLAGHASILQVPGSVVNHLEKLLEGMYKLNPKIMCVLGAIVILPDDGPEIRTAVHDINFRIARLAEKDLHWSFFDTNQSVSLAGQPQKHFFDKEGKVNKAGCRFIAQGLVATSRAARMLQNYAILPPKSGKIN